MSTLPHHPTLKLSVISMLDATYPHMLPSRVGVGYKAQHYMDITKNLGPLGWLEIHA